MVKKKTKKKKKRNEKSNGEDSEVKEYGVILTKDEKYRPSYLSAKRENSWGRWGLQNRLNLNETLKSINN